MKMSDFIWLNPFIQEEEHKMTLAELYPDWWRGDGLFHLMDLAHFEMPWSDYIGGERLDILYFGSHSGGKLCSPFIKRYAEVLDNDYHLLRENLPAIIRKAFGINWAALWNTYEVEYNPLHNYDMTETRELTSEKDESKVTDGSLRKTGTDALQHGKTESVSKSSTETGTQTFGKIDTTTHGKSQTDALQHGENETITHGKSVTDALTHGKTDTTTHGKTVNDDNYRYGFNSGTTPEPSDKETIAETGTTAVATTGTDRDVVTESGTTATAHSGTDTRTITDSGTTRVAESGSDGTSITESGQESLTSGGTDTQTKNLLDETDVTETLDQSVEESEETHRSGNIGVTTTQKLIQEEREVWLWNYFEQVFNDVDSLLALQIHDPCRV